MVSMKVLILSLPFAVWLGFRQIYWNYFYDAIPLQSAQVLRSIASCLFYVAVWELGSFSSYVLGHYPKHYQSNMSQIAFDWMSPRVFGQNSVLRIVAFNL